MRTKSSVCKAHFDGHILRPTLPKEPAPTAQYVAAGNCILCAPERFHAGRKTKVVHISDANDDAFHSLASVRIYLGRLLKRVFDIDIEHCTS